MALSIFKVFSRHWLIKTGIDVWAWAMPARCDKHSMLCTGECSRCFFGYAEPLLDDDSSVITLWMMEQISAQSTEPWNSCNESLIGGTRVQRLGHIQALFGHVKWQPTHYLQAAVCCHSAGSESKGVTHISISLFGSPRTKVLKGNWRDTHLTLLSSKVRILPLELAPLRLRRCCHFIMIIY